MLREGSADGRLSHDTFLHRMELALQARDAGQLASLLSDLRPACAPREPGRTGRHEMGEDSPARCGTRGGPCACRTWCCPAAAGRCSRSAAPGSSDLAIADMTVSWHHAELRLMGSDWVLADLGSTNGTRANGWRVGSGLLVRGGDEVTFGQVGFLLCDPT